MSKVPTFEHFFGIGNPNLQQKRERVSKPKFKLIFFLLNRLPAHASSVSELRLFFLAALAAYLILRLPGLPMIIALNFGFGGSKGFT